ncbi:HEAT repeat domain-containing protein [Chloroflexota bacterium]
MNANSTYEISLAIERQLYPAEFPLLLKVWSESEVDQQLARLTPETPWGERQVAARRLGELRNPQALAGLLKALLNDDFWMVRCSLIHALEMIADKNSIPTLREVARNDSFQAVRSYAEKAIQRISSAG